MECRAQCYWVSRSGSHPLRAAESHHWDQESETAVSSGGLILVQQRHYAEVMLTAEGS